MNISTVGMVAKNFALCRPPVKMSRTKKHAKSSEANLPESDARISKTLLDELGERPMEEKLLYFETFPLFTHKALLQLRVDIEATV